MDVLTAINKQFQEDRKKQLKIRFKVVKNRDIVKHLSIDELKAKVQKWPSSCKKYPVGLKRQDQEITNLNQLVVSCMILMMRAYATLWLFLSVPTDPKHELRQLLWWVLQCPHIFQNIYGNFRVEGRLRPLNGLEENVASDSELPGYVNFVCASQDIARL